MSEKIKLKRCPICGAKAFISHDKADGYDMGWSVGCPRFCRQDGVHGMDDLTEDELEEKRLTGFYYPSKSRAAAAWNDRCESGRWRIKQWGEDE